MSSLKSSGIIDDKGTLTAAYDAASKNWGGKWRMPTKDDFQELLDNCVCFECGLSGRRGWVFISNKPGNDNWIFLPAAGFGHGTSSHGVGSTGHYWISSTVDENSYHACYLHFDSSSKDMSGCGRDTGHSVRPVTK